MPDFVLFSTSRLTQLQPGLRANAYVKLAFLPARAYSTYLTIDFHVIQRAPYIAGACVASTRLAEHLPWDHDLRHSGSRAKEHGALQRTSDIATAANYHS